MSSKQIRVGDLYHIAGGLNIEGGFPLDDLKKTCGHSRRLIWANLVLVLDRPLVDNVIFDLIIEAMRVNKYDLLEEAIDEINEYHFLIAFYMIFSYYLNNNADANIVVHIHQNNESGPLIEICRRMCLTINPEAKISFRSDDPNYQSPATNRDYHDTDILISLSQCAGLDPKYEPGALLIPNRFIPYDIDSRTVFINQSYERQNDLQQNIDKIFQSNSEGLDYVRSNYKSKNQKKNYSLSLLKRDDFYITDILQVNKLWNPENSEELVTIVTN